MTDLELRDWLAVQKRRTELLQVQMSLHYDLDGGLGSRQSELIWDVRASLLEFGLRLYLDDRGMESPRDFGVAIGIISRLDGQLAGEIWALMLEEMPESFDDVESGVARARSLLGNGLGQPSTRLSATLAWADSVKLLRDVAHSIGLAGRDDWYLSATAPDFESTWYEELLDALSSEASTESTVREAEVE